jgi:hypothetical protein
MFTALRLMDTLIMDTNLHITEIIVNIPIHITKTILMVLPAHNRSMVLHHAVVVVVPHNRINKAL